MLDYLNLKPKVFGLDISDLSLKIIKLEKRGGRVRLASFGEKEIKPGIIQEGEIKNGAALVKILKEAYDKVRGERLGTRCVAASLPEEKAFLQVIQMPKMGEEELKKAVRFEAENYVPMSIDAVYLDAQTAYPIADHLNHLDALITALPKKTVDPYVAAIKESGMKPLVLEMESQAISRALIDGYVTLRPVLLMDLGISKTGFSVFAGHSLRFTSSTRISSYGFTQTIAEALGIDFNQAEKLKNREGIAGSKNKLFKILKPALFELAAETQKQIEYYQSHSSHEHLLSQNKNIEKIILCGGGANLKGLSNFLSLELKRPVELGNPWTNILPSSIKEVPGLPYEESLRYTTALGLALRGLHYD